jgi:hydroxymethylpyrimidine kinase/phosphomethylpyrimidine kinase/thiamine-phosphate diphosphorylase
VINIEQKKPPVVWSISGSDSGGGTGIQSDLLTYHDYKVYGCTVITAITAQNSFAQGLTVATARKSIVAQINALDSDMPADAIKIGILPNLEAVDTIVKYLQDYDGFVVYDLELEGSGEALLAEAKDLLLAQLLPRVDLLVVNVAEARALLGSAIDHSPESIAAAAAEFMALNCRSVLITGAKLSQVEGKRFDYWVTPEGGAWISFDAQATINNKGGGCVLSAAIAAGIGLGMELEQAIKLAKAYVTKGVRESRQVGNGPGAVAHIGAPDEADIPAFSKQLPPL